jgi:hypothetical protein
MTAKDEHETSRKRRLSAALRDNLKRRKAQVRGRSAGRGTTESDRSARTHDSAGIGEDKQKR